MLLCAWLTQNLRLRHPIGPGPQAVLQRAVGVTQVLHRGLKVHAQVSATGCQRQQRQVQMS